MVIHGIVLILLRIVVPSNKALMPLKVSWVLTRSVPRVSELVQTALWESVG